jgi:nucleotide-binding universal stress UspA family protein
VVVTLLLLGLACSPDSGKGSDDSERTGPYFSGESDADSDAVAHEPPEVGSAAARLRSMEGGLVTHTAAIVDGHPARAIVEYATQHSVDLIAMTTHGRGALKRLVAGSVATSVLRTTDRPMLIFRPRTS